MTAIYKSDNIDKYLNLLDIYYDIDNWGFQKNVKYPIFKAYVDYYENNVYNSDAIEKTMIDERIGQMFGRRAVALFTSKVEDGHPFTTVRNMLKDSYGDVFESITLFDSGVFVANSMSNERKILPLLQKRQDSFFKKSKHIQHPQKVRLKEDCFVEILVTSGCENKELFEYYHYLSCCGFDRTDVYLDYEKCKEEVKRISMIIAKNDNSIDLIDGI